MDLSKIDTTSRANEGADMHLEGPDGVPLFYEPVDDKGNPVIDDHGRPVRKPVTIRVLGVDSKAYRTHEQKVTNRRAKAQQTKRNYTPSAAEIEEDNIELLVNLTVGWEGIELRGKPLEYSAEAARMLYSEFRWIFEQVNRFAAERQNFLPASSKG